jgi:hypothetical protein
MPKDQPTLTAHEDGAILTFPTDDYALEFRGMAIGKHGSLYAEVFARYGEQVLFNARFDLLDQWQQERFHQRCVSMNGSTKVDWQSRLISSLPGLRKLMEQEPIPPTVPEPPMPFPLQVLPTALRDFVTAAASALPCPPDFLAVPLLAVLGAAIGTTRVVEIKPGWQESARLWTAVISDPGSKKSPALDMTVRPLYAIQHDFAEQYTVAKRDYEAELATYEVELAAWKAKKTRTADDKPPKPDVPPFLQICSTDATVEALATVLEQNPRGVLFIRDELTAWVRAMNQYKGGKGADRQHWLSFWNGSPVIVNRKNRRDALVLLNPFVGVVGCLPPDVLEELADERGREDGFVHRILFASPPSHSPTWTEAHLDPEVQQAYETVIRDLVALADFRVLRMTVRARKTWTEWITEHYARSSDAELSPALRGPWAKLEGMCARLALILQLAQHVCDVRSSPTSSNRARGDVVDAVSMTRAVTLIEDYFKSHLQTVYAQLHATPEDRRLEAVRHWVVRRGGEASFRELCRYKVAGCTTMAAAAQIAQQVVDHGLGRIEERTSTGGGHLYRVLRVHLSEGHSTLDARS